MKMHLRNRPNYTHKKIVFGHKVVLLVLRLSLRTCALSAELMAFQLVVFYSIDTDYLCNC